MYNLVLNPSPHDKTTKQLYVFFFPFFSMALVSTKKATLSLFSEEVRTILNCSQGLRLIGFITILHYGEQVKTESLSPND